jgi:hypothetical protein
MVFVLEGGANLAQALRTRAAMQRAVAYWEESKLGSPALQWIERDRQSQARYKNAVKLKDMPALTWTASLSAALAQASMEKRRVFVAFTRIHSPYYDSDFRNVFPRAAVQEGLKPYVLLILEVNQVPAEFYEIMPPEEQRIDDARANRDLEAKVFECHAIPVYAILEPHGDFNFLIRGNYQCPGITNVGDFLGFLGKPPRSRQPGWSRTPR